MYKKLTVGLAALMLVPAVYAATNVLSQNAVGYVKVTANKGELTLVRMDFVDIDGLPTTISDVVDLDSVPDNTRAFIWDTGAQGFNFDELLPATKFSPRGWAPDLTPLSPGIGFFLDIPAAAASPSYDVFLLGEVPDNASTNLVAVEALTLTGFPYPAATTWTNTSLAAAGAVGDRLFIWDVGAQGYTFEEYLAATKFSPEGWSGSPTLSPGQGYFYNKVAAGNLNYAETKPYTWP